MPKIPLISGNKAIKAFEKIGYRVVRQKGSHIRMHNFNDKSKNPLTIPRHQMLGKGLIRKLLRDAKVSLEEFQKLLKK